MSRLLALLLGLLTLFPSAGGQERVTTLGIQFKPMIPSRFFNTSREESSNGEFNAAFVPTLGYNFGMIVRHGITRAWSVESGINLVQRNYHIDFETPQLSGSTRLSFRLIGYEIPFQALFYVRLGKQLWMNASGGFSLDMYPSDVASFDDRRRDTLVVDFSQQTFRRRWIQMALLANYGFEWRTRERGFFYFGASFHRPFNEIALTEATVIVNTDPSSLRYALGGSYLTADIRYFFHEAPERRRRRASGGPRPENM